MDFMKKKIDVLLVCDASGSLKDYRERINRALEQMLYRLKTSEDLLGCEVFFSMLGFADDVITRIEFKPLNSVSAEELVLTFDGETNPGPALKEITAKAMARYDEWGSKNIERMHPILIFFTDGNPYPVDKYMNLYKNAASYIRKLEADNKILVVGCGFGDVNKENIAMLTNHKDRVLMISESNVDKLSEFFQYIIPATTNYSVRDEFEILDKLFRRFMESA